MRPMIAVLPGHRRMSLSSGVFDPSFPRQQMSSYRILGGVEEVVTILLAIGICATSLLVGAAMDTFGREFGGGWNWELGFQAGGKTLILNLF